MMLRDRDYIETLEGLLFCVVGYLHPPGRYTAYLKYLPSKDGLWSRGSTRYARVIKRYHALEVRESMRILEEKYPHYVHYCPVRHIRISMVPQEDVKRVYVPRERLAEIMLSPNDKLEKEVCRLVDIISDVSKVNHDDLGVTGSILLGIHNPEFSDIDLVVYGRSAALEVMEALAELSGREGSPIRRPGRGKLEEWTANLISLFGLSPRQAREIASRRWNYLRFHNRFFSVHPVRKDHEIRERYGEKVYYPVGVVEGECLVHDASESVFLPAIYRVEEVEVRGWRDVPEVREIVSYEGIFSSILREGERAEFRGKLERVHVKGGKPYYRVVIGTFEVRDNYIAPVVR